MYLCVSDTPAPTGSPLRDTNRKRRPRSLALAAVLLVVVGVTAAGVQAFSAQTHSDFHVARLHGAAPGFDLEDLRNARTRVALSRLRGRPIVVNFWASWCVPCRKEMPALQAMHERFAGRVTIVGVDTNDARRDALRFAREVGVMYRLAFDPASSASARYGVVGLPSTVFIDASGTLVERRLGEMSSAEFERTTSKLLQP